MERWAKSAQTYGGFGKDNDKITFVKHKNAAAESEYEFPNLKFCSGSLVEIENITTVNYQFGSMKNDDQYDVND